MIKESNVKKGAIKTIPKKEQPKSTNIKIEKALVENFVSLQKVMTNLSIKFDNLANQISKLLELFEISAKSLIEKDFRLEKTDNREDNKELIEKIDNLFEQNKTIARGLTLLHEREPSFQPQRIQYPQKIPIARPRQPFNQTQNTENYQKSISSKVNKLY